MSLININKHNVARWTRLTVIISISEDKILSMFVSLCFVLFDEKIIVIKVQIVLKCWI